MKLSSDQIYSLCSSDEEEDVPLKKLKSQIDTRVNGNDDHGSLRNPSLEKCEFCDKTFNNKYTHMIHNAKHIIIPLLNQNFHQCQECLYHFQSLDELKHHISSKHIVKMKKEISFDNSKNQPVDKVTEDISVKPEKAQDIFIINENGLENHIREKENNKVYSRLFFEEEIDDQDDLINLNPNGLLNTFVVDCKVNLETFEAPWLFSNDDKGGEDKGGADNGGKDNGGKDNGDLKLETSTDSIHNDELKLSGLQKCRICHLSFPNRFELIQHEADHIRMKPLRHYLCCICERFIAGEIQGLRKHKISKHNDFVPQPSTLRYCDRCHLRYNSYPKHVNNYHKIYVCRFCGERFEVELERDSHMRIHLEEAHCSRCNFASVAYEVEEHQKKCLDRTTIVKVCELCSMFLKDRQDVQYVYKGDFSKIGARHPCEKCGAKFFELKMLEKIRKHRFIMHIESEKERKTTKTLSNKDRLLNIRKRLKNLSKLNKYYICVLFGGFFLCFLNVSLFIYILTFQMAPIFGLSCKEIYFFCNKYITSRLQFSIWG